MLYNKAVPFSVDGWQKGKLLQLSPRSSIETI